MQIEKCYPGNYGAPGMPRKKKKKRTPEEIQRQNETNRWKKVQRLILANFKEGDWHLILKYLPKNRPGSYKEALKHRKKFIDEMRKEYKKVGIRKMDHQEMEEYLNAVYENGIKAGQQQIPSFNTALGV